MAESIADENLIHVNPATKVSQEEDLPVCLQSFGHLVLDVGSNSNSEAEDSQPPVVAFQTGYRNDHDNDRNYLHHAQGLPTPRRSSLAAPTSGPRLQQPAPFGEHHLSDASDVSSLYDGHYKTDAWRFSRGRKITLMPCLDENGDDILDECYEGDDELRTNTTDDINHLIGAVCDFITNIIPKMMFVSGETAEPSIETTTLIEDITREQVLEIVRLPLTSDPYMF